MPINDSEGQRVDRVINLLKEENRRLFEALALCLRVCHSAAAKDTRREDSNPGAGRHLCEWKDKMWSLADFARKTGQTLLRMGVDLDSVKNRKLRYPVNENPHPVPGNPYTGFPLVQCCSDPNFYRTSPNHYKCETCYAEFITEE
jgi:hypothetical protein